MATSAGLNTRQPSSTSPIKRFSSAWRAFFAPDDLIALVIVTILLLMPALALARADLPVSQRVILPVTVMSAVLGLLLSRSQFSEFLALIISATYGVCLVVMITALTQFGSLGTGVYEVFVRTVTWMVDATSGGINQDDMVFTLLVATLFWFLGYNASWHVFRIDRVWRVIFPPGLILVSNAVFYSGDANLDIYLAIFMFMALLLIVRSNLDAREWDWYLNGIRSPRHLRGQFLRVGAVLGLATLLLAWNAPDDDLQDRLSTFRDSFQEFLQAEPLQQLSEFWNRLFSPIEAQGPTTADYYGGDSLELGGAIQLGDQTVFLVDVDQGPRYYWRSRIFDTYETGRWTSAADTRLTDGESPLDVTYVQDNARTPVFQEFTVALNATRLIYTAPQPVQIDLPTRTDLRYVPSAEDANRTMNVSVIRPLQVIRRGETYTATSLLSTANADQLRAASLDYPEWIQALYLYVSQSVTPRTRALADQIVTEAGAVTPYDKAKAIESWLRINIIYNETIPQPPDGQDPVDWVLFDFQQGYCNYYASAMIMMLRHLDIPARMAAGFAQGKWDAEQGAYTVTERDAHTWVEVYFPGYGWVEFEPTAAQAPLNREGDNNFDPQAPAPQQATATPAPTATPLPTSTPNFSPTPPTPDNQNNNIIPPTPTLTPTFTPSPTATPVIIPTQPPPLTPQSQSAFDFILPAIGLALLGLLLLAVIIGLFTFVYWWWEWRGMKGLSPVIRAYARLERYIGLIGINLRPQQTPEERRRQIIKGVPQAERPVTAITRLYTAERYGPGSKHPAEGHRNKQIADEAWSGARKNILRRWLRRFMFWRRN